MALKRRSKAQVDFSMASMTDLIFLLLIFFMITASFVSPNALNLSLPRADSKVVTNPALTISIDEAHNYYVQDQKVSEELLPSAIEKELMGKPEQVIMINADKSVPVDNVVQVMTAANQLNQKNNWKIKTILATKPTK